MSRGDIRGSVGYVLLDGAADRPNPRLNFTTPLEAAYTPNLDSIARSSRVGRVVTVRRGVAPESDIAVFSMLGYSFAEGYPGRGVVEAVGAGMRFRDGDVAFRANLASVDGRKILDRRAGRNLTQEEANRIEKDLEGMSLDEAEAEFRATISYRGVLVLRSSKAISADVTNTDPAYRRVGGFGAAREAGSSERVEVCRPENGNEDARSEVNRERRREGKLPANAILLRDAGDHLPRVQKFEEKYGMRGVALVEMPAEVGIAKLLEMKMVRIGGRNDLEEKAALFSRELRDGAVVYAHIKGPDEFGHDGDALGKKKNIEKLDRHFFSSVADEINDARIAVSCDHATPCVLMRHSSDPVPLSISGRREGSRFTERASREGRLGTLHGPDVLREVLRF